jgi:hypothetical protein
MSYVQTKSRNSSVGIGTGCRLDCRDSIPGRGKSFLSSVGSTTALGLAQSPIQCVHGSLSPWVKRPRCEADHSPPSSADVKNGGATSPLPHTSSWHSAKLIKRREIVTFPPSSTLFPLPLLMVLGQVSHS